MARKGLRLVVGVTMVLSALTATAAFAVAPGAAGSRGAGVGSFREQLIRQGRVSGVVRPEASGALQGMARAPLASCTAPGGTNYMTDCNSQGRPVNETTVATNGDMWVAGANDYNSYNGHAQLGYYWSSNGRTWNDAGPLDLYPHATDNGAGDPGVAVDANGVVYYSNIFFSYTDATVGGVELARRDPVSGAWSYSQIAANTPSTFQDKPAVVLSGRNVYVCWTFFANNSTIQIAQFGQGGQSKSPKKVFQVPGTGNSQGCSLAADGRGGFWVAWEEGQSIRVGHWLRGFWTNLNRVSPDGFRDLPSPLPGFQFRNNSFPSIATVHSSPYVVWASYDTGAGRTYLYAHGSVTAVADTGGDQFFASIGSGAAGYAISWSQTGPQESYSQYMWWGGVVSRISTARSKPNKDCIFSPPGAFIGDYNSTIVSGASPMPIWTDMRRKSQACDGRAQDAMVYLP